MTALPIYNPPRLNLERRDIVSDSARSYNGASNLWSNCSISLAEKFSYPILRDLGSYYIAFNASSESIIFMNNTSSFGNVIVFVFWHEYKLIGQCDHIISLRQIPKIDHRYCPWMSRSMCDSSTTKVHRSMTQWKSNVSSYATWVCSSFDAAFFILFVPYSKENVRNGSIYRRWRDRKCCLRRGKKPIATTEWQGGKEAP